MPSVLSNIATMVVFVGVVAMAVAAIVAGRRQEGQHHRDSDALWHDLRRAHRLSRREARRLRRMAEAASLDPKTLIFLEPHVLMRLADADGCGRAEVEQLMSKLYS